MEIPIVYEVSNLSHGLHKKSSGEPEKETSPQTAATAGTSGGSQKQHFEFPPRPLLQVASQSSAYTDPMDAFNFDKPTYEYFTPLRLRPGAQKKIPVCILIYGLNWKVGVRIKGNDDRTLDVCAYA